MIRLFVSIFLQSLYTYFAIKLALISTNMDYYEIYTNKNVLETKILFFIFFTMNYVYFLPVYINIYSYFILGKTFSFIDALTNRSYSQQYYQLVLPVTVLLVSLAVANNIVTIYSFIYLAYVAIGLIIYNRILLKKRVCDEEH